MEDIIFVRQAKFREDGTLTDVPAKVTERPQLDAQGDLLQWAKEKQLLENLEDKGEIWMMLK